MPCERVRVRLTEADGRDGVWLVAAEAATALDETPAGA